MVRPPIRKITKGSKRQTVYTTHSYQDMHHTMNIPDSHVIEGDGRTPVVTGHCGLAPEQHTLVFHSRNRIITTSSISLTDY